MLLSTSTLATCMSHGSGFRSKFGEDLAYSHSASTKPTYAKGFAGYSRLTLTTWKKVVQRKLLERSWMRLLVPH